MGLGWGVNQSIPVNHLKWCIVYKKHAINVQLLQDILFFKRIFKYKIYLFAQLSCTTSEKNRILFICFIQQICMYWEHSVYPMWYYVAKYIKNNNCEEFGILQSLQANKLADHRFTIHNCEHGVLHGKKSLHTFN